MALYTHSPSVSHRNEGAMLTSDNRADGMIHSRIMAIRNQVLPLAVGSVYPYSGLGFGSRYSFPVFAYVYFYFLSDEHYTDEVRS